MTTYAIADLHGRLDLLDRALAEIGARGGGEVVFTGDYIDRGPESRGVIERLIAGPPPGQNWTLLSGNHEAFLASLFGSTRDEEAICDWLAVGGRETMISYGWSGEGTAPLGLIPPLHRAFLIRLPRFARDRHRIYVHAGLDPTLALDQQSDRRLLWQIYRDGVDLGYDGLHVVHGHEQRPDGPILLQHRTNLDVHAWNTGRLCVGVFDHEIPGGPVETFDVTVG